MKFLLTYILIITLAFISPDGEGQEALTLSLAIEKALQNNYGIIISRSDAQIATINNTWGKAGRFPVIGFDASSNNSMDLSDNSSSVRFSAGLGLDWTIFNGFKVNITKEKLENLETLAGGRLAVVIENSVEDVILGYYNVLLQKERLKVLQHVMKLSQDRYDYELARHDLGGTVTYNVLQAKNVYLSDKAMYLNQDVIVRNSIRNLNFLLGEEPSAAWLFTEQFEPDTADYVMGDLLAKMLSSNQTLQNQYVNLLLTQNETGLSKSAMYPSLSLSAGIDDIHSILYNEGVDPIRSSSLSPGGTLRLTYNLYTGGTRKQAIEVAKINEEIAQVEIEQMEHSLTNELFNLYDYYDVRKVLLNVANESLEAAELNMQIAEEKFKTGAINSFNYRDIQLIYLNSALQRLQAIYNLIESNTTLTRITGGFLNVNNP